MSLSIGLEVLSHPRVAASTGNFEEQYADAMESYSSCMECFAYGEALMNALDNTCAVHKAVKRYGFTKSMEAMIGNQLGYSTEEATNKAKEVQRNLWEKIVDWFKKIWRYIQDFFAKLFNTRRGMMLKLNDIVNNNKSYKVKDEAKTFTGFAKSDLTGSILTLFKNQTLQTKVDTITVGDTKEIKLTDANIKDYAAALLDVLKAADAAERATKQMAKEGIRVAQNGLNKPGEDIDSAREKQKELGALMKALTSATAKVFKSARAFLKYIKKA